MSSQAEIEGDQKTNPTVSAWVFTVINDGGSEVNASKRAWEFVLTILATIAVVESLNQMIPQGGWIYLINYTAGLIALTLLTQTILKRIK